MYTNILRSTHSLLLFTLNKKRYDDWGGITKTQQFAVYNIFCPHTHTFVLYKQNTYNTTDEHKNTHWPESDIYGAVLFSLYFPYIFCSVVDNTEVINYNRIEPIGHGPFVINLCMYV